jgi:hypothetical protein
MSSFSCYLKDERENSRILLSGWSHSSSPTPLPPNHLTEKSVSHFFHDFPLGVPITITYLPLPEFNYTFMYLRPEIRKYFLLVNAKSTKVEIMEYKLHSNLQEYTLRIYLTSTGNDWRRS